LTAAQHGIAVFNSPFANSRSVAELVISEIIALSRQYVDRTAEMRAGVWNKVSKGCWEVRGKTLGIVGYGHIGSQLSVLAEAFGISVIYYDVIPIMPLGSARQTETLQDLLRQADFVTLHVPEIPDTVNMIGKEELEAMKKGAYLINNARGKVVDLDALADALESGHLAGAAVDVFPREPGSNGPGFTEVLGDFIPRLRKVNNFIMTPHIGGSTEEAQRAIGTEVSTALLRYIESGTTIGAVNFPEVDLRAITIEDDRHIRVCHVHKNEPGVLKRVNNILSDHNIVKQFSDSKGDIAYLMADISNVGEDDVENIYKQISAHTTNIFTRLLCKCCYAGHSGSWLICRLSGIQVDRCSFLSLAVIRSEARCSLLTSCILNLVCYFLWVLELLYPQNSCKTGLQVPQVQLSGARRVYVVIQPSTPSSAV
jgi:D-3-phosphoglycerate dehydrogenase